MNQRSLTVVLPIHNAEATLRRSVERVLEVAGELTARLEVLIIDDGSSDDSFDIAQEIASRYRQVRVSRQPQRRGLGPTLAAVRKRINGDVVMVHDGVSAINAEHVRMLWNSQADPKGVSAADLLLPSQNQAAMAAAHGRLMGFRMLTEGASAGEAQPLGEAPIPAPHSGPRSGVGGIPPLPAPNLAGVVSNFAVGE